LLRAFLDQDRLYAAYAICDLEDREFGRTRWGVARDGDEVIAIGLEYTGPTPQPVFVMGRPDGISAVLRDVIRPRIQEDQHGVLRKKLRVQLTPIRCRLIREAVPDSHLRKPSVRLLHKADVRLIAPAGIEGKDLKLRRRTLRVGIGDSENGRAVRGRPQCNPGKFVYHIVL
jgi:hypothetical protein